MKKIKNKIFIISGPSGAGEDSIIEGLKKFLPIERIITTTTRNKRAGEKQGCPYYFISKDEFNKKIKTSKFLEYAKEYNGNLYGVTFNEMERVQKSKKIGIWKIEYQGVITAKKLMPGIIAIFINAPLSTLKKRILNRDKSFTKNYLEQRMLYTKKWLKHKKIYDYVVMNYQDKLSQAIEDIIRIIKKHLS